MADPVIQGGAAVGSSSPDFDPNPFPGLDARDVKLGARTAVVETARVIGSGIGRLVSVLDDVPGGSLAKGSVEHAPVKFAVFNTFLSYVLSTTRPNPTTGFIPKAIVYGPAGFVFGLFLDPVPANTIEESRLANEEQMRATAAAARVLPPTPPMWATDP